MSNWITQDKKDSYVHGFTCHDAIKNAKQIFHGTEKKDADDFPWQSDKNKILLVEGYLPKSKEPNEFNTRSGLINGQVNKTMISKKAGKKDIIKDKIAVGEIPQTVESLTVVY